MTLKIKNISEMNHEFYTVARRDISNLEHLDLLSINDDDLIYKAENLFTEDEARTKIRELFPNGLSNHGRQYLYDKYEFVNDNFGKSYMSYMPIIEKTFELVRRISFPERPSRFESLFGWQTLEEAQNFKEKLGEPNNKIYKVSTSSFFKADMNLLYAPTIAGTILLAEKYWQGNAGQNPCWEILMSAPIKIIEEA